MRCLLRSLLVVALTIYIAMIYASAAIAGFGFSEAAFVVLSFIFLIALARKSNPDIEVPISIAEQGQEIRVILTDRADTFFKPGRVRYLVEVRNPISGKVHKKWLPMNSDYKYTAWDPGRYEFYLKKVRIYDWSGAFWFEKKIKKTQYVQVNPNIYACQVKVSEQVRSFLGETDIYDDFRPGYDPQELFAVREFRNGDKLQRVHWKLSAKHEDLMVKENGMPKACAITILANSGSGKPEEKKNGNKLLVRLGNRRKNKGTNEDKVAFLQVIVGLSFTLMDLKCPHYVAWYSEERKDVVRARVDDEEGFYEFLNFFMADGFKASANIKSRYKERFKAERLLYLLEVDQDLKIGKNGKSITRLNKAEIEKEMEQLEIDL